MPWRNKKGSTACVQVIYLTTSKISVLALGNEALMLTVLVGQLFKTLFFGRLREAEVEHLYERSWCAPAEIQPRPGSAERPGPLELPPSPSELTLSLACTRPPFAGMPSQRRAWP